MEETSVAEVILQILSDDKLLRAIAEEEIRQEQEARLQQVKEVKNKK